MTSTLGDATVTIGGRFTAPAKVVFIHPLHNFALVQFDPKTVPDSIEVGQAPISSRPTPTGANVSIIGLKSGLNDDFDTSRRVDLIARKTRVANCGWMKLPMPNPPRYQLHNVETLGLEMAPSLDGGVLVHVDFSPARLLHLHL